MNPSSATPTPERDNVVIRESRRAHRTTVYGGYWLVEWMNSYPNTYIARDLTIGSKPVASSGEPEEWEWQLRGYTPGDSNDAICGLDGPTNGSKPVLAFEPDSEGRARIVLVDSWGEGTLTITSLGRNLFHALLGYPLKVSTDDQDAAVEELNSFLREHELKHPREIDFILEATLGAFSDTVWAGRVEMSAKGYMASLIDLAGVRLDDAIYSEPPFAGDRWLNMIEFEGFREEAPLDSSRPQAIHPRSIQAFAALINTPITISSKFLKVFKANYLYPLFGPKEVPREVFIAALMVFALEEFGDDWEQGRSSEEAFSLARWILGLENGRRSEDLLYIVEILCTPIAGWTRALQRSAIELARAAQDLNLREDEEEFSMLSSELEQTAIDLGWAAHRENLEAEIAPVLKKVGNSANIAVKDDRSKLKVVFELHNEEIPILTITPSISATRRIFSNAQHEAEYWLNWRSHGFLPNSSELELDHMVVQWDAVVASIITFTARQSGLFDPTRLTIQISARGSSAVGKEDYQ